MVEQQTGAIIEYNYVTRDQLNGSIIKFDTDNVLYSKLRPNLNKVVLPSLDGFATSEMLPLKPDTSIISKEYLATYLRSDTFVSWAVSKTAGAKMPRLGTGELLNKDIPVPSLEEQAHISSVLSKIDSLISSRKQQLAKLDELVKARFVEMFGDPIFNPHNYPICRLGDLALKISDGVHAKPEYVEEGRPFLSVVNINKRKVDFTKCKYVSEEAYQKMIKSTYPQKGDVLYTKVGATYGIPAYVDTDREFCLYVSVCLIKPNHDLINSKFLAISMDMPYIKTQADTRIKGIGVPDLHLNQISEFNILFPPREVQDSFVHYVDYVEEQELTIQQSRDKLEVLKKSLMQEYFG